MFGLATRSEVDALRHQVKGLQNEPCLDSGRSVNKRRRRKGKSKRQYWSFRPGTEVSRPDAPEAFLALLRDSVKLRLRSEVPLGVTLSGGLDSSTIARIATSEIKGPLHCFSLRYPTDRLDESRYASAVADDPDRYQMHWITPSSEGLLERE